MLKVLHYVMSGLLVAVAGALFYLARTYPDQAYGLILTGVAFFAAGITNGYVTWSKG